MRTDRIARRATIGLAVSALALLPAGGAIASQGEPSADGTKSDRQACTVEELPLPNGAVDSRVQEGDPTGRYLVGRHFGNEQWNALLWVDGEVQELTGPPSTSSPMVNDVNSSGVVIGESSTADGASAAWVYADGEYSTLAGPDGAYDIAPRAINANGDIVGYSVDDPQTDSSRPLIWSADDPGTFRELKAPRSAEALGISDGGVIVGYLDPISPDSDGYMWADADSAGTVLTGIDGGMNTRALSVRGNWIGGMDAEGTDGIGVVWNIDSGTVEAKQTTTPILEVNSDGDASNEQLTGSQFHADSEIIRADGTRIELPGLVQDGTRGVTVLFDRDAEDSAAGYATDANGEEHAVVWTGC